MTVPTLLEDFEAIVACAIPAPNPAYRGGEEMLRISAHVERVARVKAFIKAHQPWLPEKPDGFGEWVEYDGTNGPRIDESVRVLTRTDRKQKATPFYKEAQPAHYFAWLEVVAFCRPERIEK